MLVYMMSIRTIRLKQKPACTQDLQSDFPHPYEPSTSFATGSQVSKDASSELGSIHGPSANDVVPWRGPRIIIVGYRVMYEEISLLLNRKIQREELGPVRFPNDSALVHSEGVILARRGNSLGV
jgi:hypothetical protein